MKVWVADVIDDACHANGVVAWVVGGIVSEVGGAVVLGDRLVVVVVGAAVVVVSAAVVEEATGRPVRVP